MKSSEELTYQLFNPTRGDKIEAVCRLTRSCWSALEAIHFNAVIIDRHTKPIRMPTRTPTGGHCVGKLVAM